MIDPVETKENTIPPIQVPPVQTSGQQVDTKVSTETDTQDIIEPASIEPVQVEKTANTDGIADDEAQLQALELEALKEKARKLQITFHPKIGFNTLKERVDEKQKELDAIAEKLAAEKAAEGLSLDRLDKSVNSVDDINEKGNVRQQASKEALKLIRVRIQNMDPSKKDYDGEVFTVSNSVVGTQRKYVPYDRPWHIPQIMLNMLRDKLFQTHYKERSQYGVEVTKTRLSKTFAIEILPPLTTEEMDKLKQRQLASKQLND